MHMPGAHVAKIAHPAVCLCVLPYKLYKGINILEYACTHRVHRLETCAPGSQNVHTGCRVHP